MEFLIVFIASMLAGVGTGLVGLSAATAMVPLMVVLCPTFQGAHGAYMATAVALASDVLGSAVTTTVYAKNKNIDLKHGWLFMTCVIGMCTAGSIAAYFVKQQVLGGFSLFLCVAIGIRFLVKPGSRETSESKGVVKLSLKEIAVSLFFGLTIGFGTGFFGSGGGMMMLIVFTAMLGYDRKTAVGTSTFVMTFTALIASVSHIMVEPEIVYECWQYLLTGIVTATAFSLMSARFANKVDGKVVGYVTGAILLSLGLVLVFLQYKEQINMFYFAAFWKLFFQYVGIIVLCAVFLIILRATIKIPDYIFRKLLHMIAFGSIFPLILLTDIWWIAALVEFVLIGIIFVALHLAEPLSFYSGLFVEKGKHEVITSFVMLFCMMTLLISVIWGVLGEEWKYIIPTYIMAWGPGDAMAAIIGRNFGKHKLSGKWIEGVKSIEGTVAMGVTSFLCTGITLGTYSPFSIVEILVTSLVVAVVAAFTELYSKRGLDTITVPIASCLVLCLKILV